MRGSWFRSLGARLLMMAGGVLAGLLLMEVGLQLVARSPELDRPAAVFPAGAEGARILALGDSNTYGLWLEDRERGAYPAVLQSRWNRSHPDEPIRVLNLGYPGTNTSRLRNALPSLLESARPDAVTIMVGVNDFWTEPEPVGNERSRELPLSRRVRDSLWRQSRVYRTLFMLMRGGRLDQIDEQVGGAIEVETADGTVELGWLLRREPVFDVAATRANLAAMVAAARATGVEPVLLTYPSYRSVYETMNGVIRDVARRNGVAFVDLEPTFRELCRTDRCERYLYEDEHPTAAGHAIAGATLAARWPRTATR